MIVLIAGLMFIPEVETKYELQECIASVLLAAIVAALSAAGQLGGQAAANQKAGIERKRYENQLNKRIDDLDQWFNTENSRDFLTTDVAQSSIRGLLGQQDRQIDALNNASAAGGATQEANIAAKGRLNENFADAIGRLLGYGTDYKQRLRQQYDYRLQSLYQPMDQLAQSKVADYGTLSNNIANAGNSVSMAAGMIDWEDLLGGNKSGVQLSTNYISPDTWGSGYGGSV